MPILWEIERERERERERKLTLKVEYIQEIPKNSCQIFEHCQIKL
jgi:hypothetical protein